MNDDICIHCKRTLEYHIDGRCFGFKSISQHYAELRGPENLKVMESAINELMICHGHSATILILKRIDKIIEAIQAAIEASKPPKE